MAGLFAVASNRFVELAEHMRANRIALIAGEQITVRAFVHVNVEMVEPEIDQQFLQLMFAINGAQNFGFGEI